MSMASDTRTGVIMGRRQTSLGDTVKKFALQRLAHRAPLHTVLIGQRPNRQTIDAVIAANGRKRLHP
jgi:hypothetical protein